SRRRRPAPAPGCRRGGSGSARSCRPLWARWVDAACADAVSSLGVRGSRAVLLLGARRRRGVDPAIVGRRALVAAPGEAGAVARSVARGRETAPLRTPVIVVARKLRDRGATGSAEEEGDQ